MFKPCIMKIIYTCLLLFIIAIFGCNNKTTPFLKTSNLESSFIAIDGDSAYTLKTGKGSIIKIAAGTFVVKAGEKINLEIKEAFTMNEILLAGLTTQSNGRSLESGGMIFFNATSEGKQLDLKKPVSISIPSEIYDPGMQLFEGEIKEDSSVNWVNPTPLDTTPNAALIRYGEQLFEQQCSSCHKVLKDFTGPALFGFASRAPNKQWVYDFIKSPANMIAYDPYGKFLFDKWKPTVMTGFPALEKKDVDAILAYVANEEKLNPQFNDSSLWSCGYDTLFRYPETKFQPIEIIREENIITPTLTPDIVPKDFAIRQGIYQFEIEDNGWYNIDRFLEEEKLEDVTIDASLNLETKADMKAYLFLPESKMMVSGALSNTNTVLFDYGNNRNELRIKTGVSAILLLMGSDKTDMYYAIKSFKVQKIQSFTMIPVKTTEAALLETIKQNKIGDFKIDVFKKEVEVRMKPCNGWPEVQPTTDTTKVTVSL